MLGMMNCPTDSDVEFYAAPPAKPSCVAKNEAAASLDVFVQAKDRPSVTYTKGSSIWISLYVNMLHNLERLKLRK